MRGGLGGLAVGLCLGGLAMRGCLGGLALGVWLGGVANRASLEMKLRINFRI